MLLVQAVKDGDVAVVRRILDEEPNVDVNAITDTSNTLLHFAVRRNMLEIVKLLVEHHADIDAQSSSYGITPLYWSAFENHVSILAYLCFMGADVNRTSSSWLPLHTASGHGFTRCIEILAAFGSAMDKPNSDRRSPLAVAFVNGQLNAVRLLLALNADMSGVEQEDVQFHKFIAERPVRKDREKSRKEILERTIASLSGEFLKLAHPTIVNVCIALAPLRLPQYVLLWIIDELPNYKTMLSHHGKLRLIENLLGSIRKIRPEDE